MKKSINQLDKVGNKNPFIIPEGYFDNLTDQIMTQLPQKVEEEPREMNLWERVKPWAYMAAMFVGIALMVKLFVVTSVEAPSGLNLTSAAEMEEFYQYYEEQLANSIYRETIYLSDFENYESFE